MSRVEQELPTLPGHLISPQVLSGVCVGQSLVFCVIFCRSLFVFFRLAILLSILRCTVSNYPSGIFKLFYIAKREIKDWVPSFRFSWEPLYEFCLVRIKKKSQREDEHVWHPYECRLSVEKHFIKRLWLRTIIEALFPLLVELTYQNGLQPCCYIWVLQVLLRYKVNCFLTQFIDTFLPFVLILYIK